MNSFELNKIFGAILGTLVLVMGVGFIAEEIYAPIENRGSTFNLPEPKGGEGGGETEVAQVAPIAVRMAEASAADGEAIIVRCQSCHDYSSANENRTGPGLYGIVGNGIAQHEGFSYSDALLTLAQTEEVWTYEHIDAFIASPQTHAPGTTMSFPGLADPDDRADLIAFLRENDDSPEPLPEVSEDDLAGAEGEDAPAEEGEAAEGEDESAEAGMDYATLIGEADIGLGESVAARCQGCHDFSEAMETRVGPALYDVVERPIASLEGYGYSDALTALGEAGEVWDFAHLDGFLTSPSAHAPGTTMGFAGIADDEERIALIAWMREQAAEPVALEGAGEAEEAPAEEEAAPAPAEDAAPAEEEAPQQEPAETAAPEAEEDEAPVVETETPEADPTPAEATGQTPGAGQEGGDVDSSPVTGEGEAVQQEAN